jgi:hypothetical protein
MPIDIAQDAQRMNLLIQYDALTADEVVAWANSLVAELDKMDSPPGLLFALSNTSPSNAKEILFCLAQLSAGADFWTAFRRTLPRLREYVTEHPDRTERIANHLFSTLCRYDVSDVPDDLHFLYRFDDAFSLAQEGHGDTETVYREFVHELDRFIQVA